MPLKLNCGVNKKVGQPDFGSLGASCNIEIEMDGSLILNDLETFHDRVRQAFAECRKAVNDELAQQQNPGNTGHSERPVGIATSGNGNGSKGNTTNNGHAATDKQLGYIRQLAGQIEDLGVGRLDDLTDRMYRKPLSELSTLEGSSVIDVLKEIKAGTISLEHALNGATK